MKKPAITCLLLLLCFPLSGLTSTTSPPERPAPEAWRISISDELDALNMGLDAPFIADDSFTTPGIRLFTTAGGGKLNLHQRLQDEDTPLHYCISVGKDFHKADPAGAWTLIERAIPAFVHVTDSGSTEEDAQILLDELLKLIDKQAKQGAGTLPIDTTYSLGNNFYSLYSGNEEFPPSLGVEYFDSDAPNQTAIP